MQGDRALWCYSVQRSYASEREASIGHGCVPALSCFSSNLHVTGFSSCRITTMIHSYLVCVCNAWIDVKLLLIWPMPLFTQGQWPTHESTANEASHGLGGYRDWSSRRTCRILHLRLTWQRAKPRTLSRQFIYLRVISFRRHGKGLSREPYQEHLFIWGLVYGILFLGSTWFCFWSCLSLSEYLPIIRILLRGGLP